MLSRGLATASRALVQQVRFKSHVAIASDPFDHYCTVTEHINSQYIPERFEMPPKPDYDNEVYHVSEAHWHETWSDSMIRSAAEKSVMATWTPSNNVKNLMIARGSEGVYIVDSEGNKYLDWTSQAVCSNLGHDIPEEIRDAVDKQIQALPMVYPGLALTEIRCRLASLLSELCPGDINGFIFALGGSDANEAAIRMARLYTGRNKILTQYRSYHGGSTSPLAATGDSRRWFAESGTTGFIKTFNPQPFGFSFAESDKEKTEMLLAMLEEQINMECPASIAAIMLESIVGAGGVLVPPKGYIEGVRALCDRYGIQLIMDEVMVGFGRTGKFWGFQHFEGVIPDIVTSAKGLSAAYLPVSMVGCRQHLKDFFEDHPLGWGATYASHPVALACAYETIKYLIKQDLVGKAASMEPIMIHEMERIAERHPSILQGRAVGLFGCFDLIGKDGKLIQRLAGPSPSQIPKFRQALFDNGLFSLFRPPLLHCAPPLVISEDELLEGFHRLSNALHVLDEAHA